MFSLLDFIEILMNNYLTFLPLVNK